MSDQHSCHGGCPCHVDGRPALDWVEFDELRSGARRELIARHVETGRTIGVRFPAAWTEVDVMDALDPDYRPVVDAP